LCSLISRVGITGERKDTSVEQVGARELKQHTGEILERVRMGERVLITHRGEAVAVISPIDQEALRQALASEAGRAEQETLGWLAASEAAFSFWENEDDAVWDEIGDRAAQGAEG
jgi:prevent-host-death family protein